MALHYPSTESETTPTIPHLWVQSTPTWSLVGTKFTTNFEDERLLVAVECAVHALFYVCGSCMVEATAAERGGQSTSAGARRRWSVPTHAVPLPLPSQ